MPVLPRYRVPATLSQERPSTARRPASPIRWRSAPSPTRRATQWRRSRLSSGPKRSPLSSCATRSIGPPARGATTGSPAACASWMVWPKVSSVPACRKMSKLAYAAGLPVVAPRAGGPIDLVAHEDNGLLFGPDDNRDLRHCVARLVGDGALRHRMGEAGRRAVLGRSWESVCGTLQGHYERVIDERQAVLATTAVPLSMQR